MPRSPRYCTLALPAVSLALAVSCGDSRTPADPATSEIFVDRAAQAGIDFVHFNGMSGEYYYCEMMGSGGALLDYDNDGDLDAFLLQGTMLGPGKTLAEAKFPPAAGSDLRDRLYRSELVGSAGEASGLRFTDVTAGSGIETQDYGMGVAAADYDNDGWVDLYVANFGENRLFRNLGDGSFAEVTRETGTAESRWSVSASFLDFDRDGWLDLYVANYVDFSFVKHKECYASTSRREYCGPLSFNPLPDRLFRNRGDGTFEDASTSSGIVRSYGGALGVATADFNGDGWIDIYVANDETPNQLWINRKDGTFSNDAPLAGCALNVNGSAESSMGVAAADFDGDGDEDLFMTHLKDETNTIYVNDGRGWFEDRTFETNLGVQSVESTGFGTGWFDYDNDGWLDLLTVNGEVRELEELVRRGDPYPLHQPNQLFRNLGDGRFRETTGEAGAVFELSEVSRGAAFGDVDNDGDTDVLIVNNNGPARLLVNELAHAQRWLGVRLLGQAVDRDMLGARVVAVRPDSHDLWRRVRSDGSYGSASDPRVLFGLGQDANVHAVRVYWPGGRVEEWSDLQLDGYTTLREGSGQPAR